MIFLHDTQDSLRDSMRGECEMNSVLQADRLVEIKGPAQGVTGPSRVKHDSAGERLFRTSLGQEDEPNVKRL